MSDLDVWTTPHGRTYHGDSCPSLLRYPVEKQKKHEKQPVEVAKNKGLEPCHGCRIHGRLP